MPLFRICGTDAAPLANEPLRCSTFAESRTSRISLQDGLLPPRSAETALARALVHRPKILVAITPRGGDELFDLALRTARELGLCVLWAGQDGKAGEKAHRVIQVRDGRISSDRQL